jgi:cytochrome oxidase Cu insertion factor (SCO1/SenC/PrrC family)
MKPPLRAGFVATTGLALALGGCHRAPANHGTTTPNRANGGAMWAANYFPNISLTTHRGEKVRFFDDLVKDKVVAINFIYTTCPDACPMETARLRQVQRLLGDRLGKDIFFYSISIDPEHDTPEVLNAYAKAWNVGPGWTFLTGAEADITALRKKLGVYEPDLKSKDHGLNIIIGNQKTGRWMKRSPGENPYVLATQLGSWLHNWKLPVAKNRSYENAPQVRNISAGEEIFRARCSSCHTVGKGETKDVEARRVGPDLLDVTRKRDRSWLMHWLMAPDRMLADKDPLAIVLAAPYKGVVMPNLRLDPSEAENLLRYIDEESGVVARARAARDNVLGTPIAATNASAVVAGKEPPTPTSADPLLVSYDRLRARLAADDLAGAQAQAKIVADAANKAAKADVAATAGAVATAQDIESARTAFGNLSRKVVALAVDNPRMRAGWHLFLCPMASGYKKWIQASPTLNNPYWGKQMLTCGRELTNWVI